jgi:hypothetical protein
MGRVRALVVTGALIIVAATFIPVNGGGDAGYATAIFDRSVQRELQLFALEPLAVALLAILVAFLLLRRRPQASAGMLIAFGLQTAVLFFAYTVIALFGNPSYNSFEPGGALGLLGALLIVLAGVGAVALRSEHARRSRGRAQPAAL